MKLVELILDDADIAGVQAISLVAQPAIEENWVYFDQQTPYTLAAIDPDKRTVVGPALIPNKRILRIDPQTAEPYEVYFSAETIRRVAEKYMVQARQAEATYMHQVPVDGVVTTESWVIEDPERDKSKVFGFNLPEGTWMVAQKIYNEQMWEKVKKEEIRGFSIEGYFADQLIAAQEVRLDLACAECPDDPAELLELQNLIAGELDPVLIVEGSPYFRTFEEADLYNQVFHSTKGAEQVDVIGIKLWRVLKRVEFESFQDYPQAVRSNAKRGIELNEKQGNKCATQVGKMRAQQLAQGAPISEDTVARMYSYLSRAEEYYDESDTTACGTISFLLWGGKAGLRWARSKVEQFDSVKGNKK